ncbi:MAG TPA: hypothetical protein VKE96_33630 [Vicinamibacterales bacterium]|nr:hypothetical protein [Vicinamibacterales bacterium]
MSSRRAGARFAVGVEAETDGDTGVVRPALRRQFPADAGELDGLVQLLVGPLRARLVGGLLLTARGGHRGDTERCCYEKRNAQRDRRIHHELRSRVNH